MTLLEVMIVILLLAIITGIVIPRAVTDRPEVLRSAAEVLAADLAFARSLAVTRGGPHKVVLFPGTGTYWIEYAGNNPALAELPSSPFAALDSTSRRLVFRLEEMAGVGRGITIWGCIPSQGSGEQTIIFDPLGSLVSPQDITIVLTALENHQPWYVAVRVRAATGHPEVGNPTRTPPAAAP
jgi:type II secretory pathway pseudopilin PulG